MERGRGGWGGMRGEGRGVGAVAQRIWGDEESVSNHPDEPVVKALGQHKNTPSFVGRALGHVQLYREWERGGRRPKNDEPWHLELSGPVSYGGLRLLHVRPLPPPPNFQVLPAAQSEERFLRRWGPWSGRVRGGQTGIGCLKKAVSMIPPKALHKTISSKICTKQPSSVPTSYLVVTLSLYIFVIVCS